jgi:hypothetical protein
VILANEHKSSFRGGPIGFTTYVPSASRGCKTKQLVACVELFCRRHRSSIGPLGCGLATLASDWHELLSNKLCDVALPKKERRTSCQWDRSHSTEFTLFVRWLPWGRAAERRSKQTLRTPLSCIQPVSGDKSPYHSFTAVLFGWKKGRRNPTSPTGRVGPQASVRPSVVKLRCRRRFRRGVRSGLRRVNFPELRIRLYPFIAWIAHRRAELEQVGLREFHCR